MPKHKQGIRIIVGYRIAEIAHLLPCSSKCSTVSHGHYKDLSVPLLTESNFNKLSQIQMYMKLEQHCPSKLEKRRVVGEMEQAGTARSER